MKIIQAQKAPKACWAYSQAIQTWSLLFCAGQIWINPSTDSLVEWWIAPEAKQTIINIWEILKEVGLNYPNVIKTTVFLSDINDWGRVNEIYWEYFAHKPARSTVAVVALPAWAKVEIEVIAEMW